MKTLCAITSCWLIGSAMAGAQRLDWKLTDFQPLTSLPWEAEDATVEGVLQQIFRETNNQIRYPVLAEYLRTVPLKDFDRAFDLAIQFEGVQQPDELVSLMLGIWAERDPRQAWERTKALFHLVGLEAGWLGYDSVYRERITVTDEKAIQGSRFWLRRESLLPFAYRVDDSKMSVDERVELLKAFADQWLTIFKSWPREWSHADPAADDETEKRLINVFHTEEEPAGFNASGYWAGFSSEAEFEVCLRRWLVLDPKAMPEILKVIAAKKWQSLDGKTPEHPAVLSTELLLLWAKLDPVGLQIWADTPTPPFEAKAWTAKCILMDRVDSTVRDRWLAQAVEGDEEQVFDRLPELAAWHPELGVSKAIMDGNPELICEVLESASVGPWHGWPENTCHPGLGFLKEFALTNIPAALRSEVVENWIEAVDSLEWWGGVDAAEAARYGMDFLLNTSYTTREDLIAYLPGGGDEGGMMDRTFCALRVWAVTRPDEMKKWIETQEDAGVRQALMKLFDHRWGITPERP